MGREEMSGAVSQFSTVGASVAASIIERNRRFIYELVKDTYRTFGAGRAINPQSSFLTFTGIEKNSLNRIIALPAYIHDDIKVAGLKWISSFPGNLETGLSRSSGVLILNDMRTGFPYACMEGSLISAARTAASAVLGADVICNGDHAVPKIGFVGNGLIAFSIFQFFESMQWQFGEIGLFDLKSDYSRAFKERIEETYEGSVTISDSLEDLIRSSDLIVFATTSGKPYVSDARLFARKPRVLNISLRDLDPEIILMSDNLVDDTDHCLRANTSLHLAEQMTGSRSFVSANIYDCLDPAPRDGWRAGNRKTTIFSPFGMGILDLAVGDHIFRQSAKEGSLTVIDGFFPSS
jgi:N-[(2S)-2-amino-2-carboxyethyl]-L-glutamate dehydrogenase